MNKVLLYFVLSILIVKVFNEACSSKEGEENIEDSECRQLSITEGNPSVQYICIKNTESSGCKEEKLCQFQEGQENCSGYPTEIGYKCIKNGEKCEAEQIICGEETDNDVNDEYCQKLKVDDGYKCIKGSTKCESKQINCGEETDNDVNDEYCQKLKVDDGYKCIKGSTKCESKQINCGEEGAGKGSSDLCPLLKVDDEEHKACVKHETEARCIVATNCVDVKVDATDEICAKLSVDSGKKCLKVGVACVAKTICNGAAGTSDDECKDFWVSDSNSKKCAKKEGEDKCEEVSKAEEEQPTQQQTPNPTPTPASEASQNTQTTQNSQTTSSDTTSSTTQATKSSNLSSADGIKMSLMILIIMFIL